VTGGEVHAIAAGWAHTCAITPQGGVQCWGNNEHGQLGDGSNKPSNVPVNVIGLSGGTNIVAGSNHTCVLAGSTVWCWGQNDKGQLGDGTTADRNKPVQVLSGVANLTAGADYTCAILRTGRVMCWGNNENGQLADGTKTSHTLPSPARLITGVSYVDGGQNKTCALNPAGLITCWSGGGAGQNIGGLVPVTGGKPESNVAVAVNRFGSLVVGVDEQGVPITFQSGQFTAVNTLSGVIYVDSGLGQVCALLGDRSVKCWGANNFGQLGNNTTLGSPKPVGVMNLAGASDLAVGRNHACVIVNATVNSTIIKCWGLNSDGQLGNGSTVNSPLPVDVSSE
jgi:alpha-tubulin suppressor-like RCC1 family protein